MAMTSQIQFKQFSNTCIFRMACQWEKYYAVEIVDDILHLENPTLSSQLDNRKALMVVDHNVFQNHESGLRAKAAQLKTAIMVLECSEDSKSLVKVEEICKWAIGQNLDRKSVLIAVGGGVLTDLVRMAASNIRRGIAHICIPTSLIGQIDASIGVKAAVNFESKKSYLGDYVPPEAVYIDRGFLDTLPKAHIVYGLAEIIKMAIIRSRELFDLVSEYCHVLISTNFSEPNTIAEKVIFLSARLMLEELEPNIFENKTYERLVDFGHTISPLIEADANWKIHHGEAVAIDMALSAVISHKIGILEEVELNYIISTILAIGLPIYASHLTVNLCRKALLEAALHRGGSPNLVLPTEIGCATFLKSTNDLPENILTSSIEWLAQRAIGIDYATWNG